MPTFAYESMDPRGNEAKGAVRAADEAEAQAQLRAMGHFVITLKAACPYCQQPVVGPGERCSACGRRLEDEPAAAAPTGAALAAEPAEGPWEARALAALRQGRGLEAVKLCREATGVDLKTAFHKVEALACDHGIPGARRSSGCTSSAAWLLALAVALAGYLCW